MKEQEVTNIVHAVLGELNHPQHVCSCSQRMTLKLANALIEKVKAKAEQMGVKAVIAVSDQAARPVAVQCMDDAYPASYDIAVNKTFTSAGLKMSTEELSGLSQPGAPLYGIQHTNQGRIVIFGGGEPLRLNGKIIGALGVSGGSASEDTMLAAYGREIFEEVAQCQSKTAPCSCQGK